MNLLYEKTRLAGGRMFRWGDSDSDSDSSSYSTSDSDSSSSWGSYSGGGDYSGYTTGSDSNYGSSTSGSGGYESAFSPGTSVPAAYSQGYQLPSASVMPGTYTPGMSSGAANLIGTGAGILAGGPLGLLGGKALSSYLQSDTYTPGMAGWGDIPGETSVSASSSSSGSSDSGSSGGAAGGGSGGSGGTAASGAIGSLDALFGSLMGGTASFTPPEYQDDPSGLFADAQANFDGYSANFNNTYGLLQTEVNRFNDPNFVRQMRDQRIAGVQQQADAGYQTAVRDMQRRGVNPNSGAFAAMSNQRAMQTALGKVQAAAQSDKDLRDTYTKGLTGLSSMNNDFGKTSSAWGSLGLDATKNVNNFNMMSSELGLKANGGPLNWAQLAMDKYRADRGLEGTKYSSDASNDVNWGALAAGSLLNNDSFWENIF